jgi:hypothetical protein
MSTHAEVTEAAVEATMPAPITPAAVPEFTTDCAVAAA